jgi:predicted HicB family RNase H-like nuclease
MILLMNRKQIKEQAGRYVKYVEWSDEDGCFIGRCPELFSGAVHGNDEAKVYAELCQTAEEWVRLIENDGNPLPEPLSGQKKFSGKFVLRLDPALHRRLAAKSLASGESLNSFCAQALTKS